MSIRERKRFYRFLILRSFVAILDLAGVLLLGFLATSIALFVTLGSDPNRTIEFAGLSLPALNAQTLPIAAILILSLFVLKALISIWMTQRMAFFLAEVEARAAESIARKTFGSGLERSKTSSREEVYFGVESGSPAAFNYIPNSLGTVVSEGVLFVLIIGAFFVVDPIAAFATIFYFGVIGVAIQILIGNLTEKAARHVAEATVEANSAIGDLSEVIRESTILNSQQFFLSKILKSRLRAASSSANQYVLSGMPRYIVETALLFAVAFFILWQAAVGDLVAAAGTVAIFLSGGLRLTASLLPLQNALVTIQHFSPSARIAMEFLAGEQEGGYSEEKVGPLRPRSSPKPQVALGISFERVSYAYPGSRERAISDISIEILPGQQVAFIGPSGSGKSTIADLILGLLAPAEGRVLAAGRHPQELGKEHPGLLAYVPQSPGLVMGTILTNIALGVEPQSIDRLRLDEAVEQAHLSELISSLPDGLETDIGKRKNELSGGQIQRIGLARALYNRPRLLVLDEATSALDAQSEDVINIALNKMRGQVTVVLIAHRLNTVQRSDRVFLVEGGSVSASGTFSELVKNNRTVENLAQLMALEGDQ